MARPCGVGWASIRSASTALISSSNAEQAPANHYNPDQITRHADLSINGGPIRRILFPTTFHSNDFRELTVPVTLKKGTNRLTFTAEELPDFDGDTYNQYDQRSLYAPAIGQVAVTRLAKKQPAETAGCRRAPPRRVGPSEVVVGEVLAPDTRWEPVRSCPPQHAFQCALTVRGCPWGFTRQVGRGARTELTVASTSALDKNPNNKRY
ncbi:hypothetical protein ACFYXF_10125 [Streptomyces sp. NPDC002680]|uniref:hypothetical protein n=1 Tax=Streptomyces sp. NPDC002680 TaxID=3364659 RepID=UPI0036896372